MLTVKGLTKDYGRLRAIDNLEFEVEDGIVYGFVGPNGAGKTTTIDIIATVLNPTSGDALVDGYSVIKDRDKVKYLIGYMPDFYGVYNDMTVEEYLEFFCSAYGIEGERRKKRIDELLELFQLGHKREEEVESLSRGMRQKLCLARALVHDPPLLLLDEPASGLDPRARAEVLQLLKDLARQGKTVFVSSHILPEIGEICDKVGIIEKGKLLISERMDRLEERVKGYRTIKVEILEGRERAEEILKAIPEVIGMREVERGLELDFRGGEEALAGLLEELVKGGVKVFSFAPSKEISLTDIFLRITKGETQ
ncbi:ABC transporter ATP-binding protein [bacterium]|nr:ABC transporter ATP-binding protein [bacterium]